ncbi:MAG: GyrI-like domain-containing protein [Saprospiraceae bacterium]|nr:GyrI-like domain-containing protein [Saprospiraceae bacterium]MCF8249408.1 GyrI-like domain-containing protein [Saprospiraceae bacterium]MCF8279062.1 GyrI-like domain-containing protein [Bacteroidales bacterium]MCF8311537.1 GyrI-like domain-containing protein [Saprospiraceae bacterium]MCF8440027.1 GyrI-like domain-containing protein [Saprospiraceae bacterium]
MRVLKLIGLAILGLVILWLIVAAFIPKHFEYERSANINASKEVVFGIVNDLKTQETWGPWKKEDPLIKNTYNEVATGVGQISSWTSEGSSGNGTQTITAATPSTSVTYRIDFGGGGGGDAMFNLADASNGITDAKWKFTMDVPYPFNLMMSFGGGQMNKMLDDGLAGLKEMAEQKAAETPATTGKYEVKSMNFPGHTYIGLREKTTQEEVMKSTFFAERFGKIMSLLTTTKIQPAGSPSGVYYTWDEATKTTDMAVAIPVNSGTAVAGGAIQVFEIPASKAVVVDYYGPYDNFEGAHEAIGEYIKANGLTEKAPVIEEYVTDPGSEKDSTKWLTKIIYLIEGN